MKNKNAAAVALAKLRHQKSPKPQEFYEEISRKGVEARLKKRIAADPDYVPPEGWKHLLDEQPSA